MTYSDKVKASKTLLKAINALNDNGIAVGYYRVNGGLHMRAFYTVNGNYCRKIR